ncbi:MAG: endonuclease III domain-containing protein [Promethearchaeia archaeon]
MNYRKVLEKIENKIDGNAHLDELAQKVQDPFKILISTILSARTRDENTRQATQSLFSHYSTPEEIAKAEREEIEQLIYKAGFYRSKAKYLQNTSKMLIEEFEGKVPDDFKKLTSLSGVGPKTANCVLVYAFKHPAIPVDTHVHRISNRLGWVSTMKPKETEKELRKKLPKDLWLKINRLFVSFGQQICRPNNPKHDECPVEESCPKDFSMEKAQREKRKKKS